MGYLATPSPTDPDTVEVTGTGEQSGFTATVSLDPGVAGVDRTVQLCERFQAAWAAQGSAS